MINTTINTQFMQSSDNNNNNNNNNVPVNSSKAEESQVSLVNFAESLTEADLIAMFKEAIQCLDGKYPKQTSFADKNFFSLRHLSRIPIEKVNELSNEYAKKLFSCSEFLKKEISSTKAFGKAMWEKYYGITILDEEPPIDIEEVLNTPCPVYKEKAGGGKITIGDTHWLTFIPQNFYKNRLFPYLSDLPQYPLNLRTYRNLIESPVNGKKICTSAYFGIYMADECWHTSPKKPYWLLMTKKNLPGTNGMKYSDQCEVIANLAQKSKMNYVPANELEGTVSILNNHIITDQTAEQTNYGKKSYTYTHVQPGYPKLQSDLGSKETTSKNKKFPLTIGWNLTPKKSAIYLGGTEFLDPETDPFLYGKKNTGIGAVVRLQA